MYIFPWVKMNQTSMYQFCTKFTISKSHQKKLASPRFHFEKNVKMITLDLFFPIFSSIRVLPKDMFLKLRCWPVRRKIKVCWLASIQDISLSLSTLSSPPSIERDFLQLSNWNLFFKTSLFFSSRTRLLFCMLDCTSLDAWQFIIKLIIGPPLCGITHTHVQAYCLFHLTQAPNHLHTYSVKTEFDFKSSLELFTFLNSGKSKGNPNLT